MARENPNRLVRIFQLGRDGAVDYFFGDIEVSAAGDRSTIVTGDSATVWDRISKNREPLWVKHSSSESVWFVDSVQVVDAGMALSCERLDLAWGRRVMGSVQFLNSINAEVIHV